MIWATNWLPVPLGGEIVPGTLCWGNSYILASVRKGMGLDQPFPVPCCLSLPLAPRRGGRLLGWHIVPGRCDEGEGIPLVLFAAPQSHCEVRRAVPRMEAILKGLIFLSGSMNKPLAGCQLVAGERLPSLPGDQVAECPVREGEENESCSNQLWPGNLQPICFQQKAIRAR